MILIVGAGIAGLAAALALEGFADVRVVERRRAADANAGAGIQLAPNAVAALRAVGAADRVIAAAAQPDGLVVRSSNRRNPVGRLDYAVVAERYGAPSLTASRAALHGALLEEVEARGTIAVDYDVAATDAFHDGDDYWVQGVEGLPELIIAADGVGSTLRASLVGDAEHDGGWVAWRGRGGAASGNVTELIMSAGHHLVRYGLDAAEDNCVLVARYDRNPTGLSAGADDVTEWTSWPIRTRPEHVYHHGRVAFVGDAAHAMEPFLAQGAAMALEDAATLGAMVRRHGIGEAALAAYAAERVTRTERLARQTRQQGSIYHFPLPLAIARDFAMERLGAEGILSRVDWIYRWTPPQA
ncbi:FAD-dependent monooxygenase [Acuticoccus mangrovi]|uniref:FAD-dependent monooxygenase n=1 Tax=Acuticoccus mangrovi TaxID=2796142 RepID=A0A934MJE9_9HYPH|nr:FAD-dependent monooxygenase [Acuticoccus mangrovi]MBJ3774494.1 FAD-dependent monooxygenase [Acuticoccus mangrovi]